MRKHRFGIGVVRPWHFTSLLLCGLLTGVCARADNPLVVPGIDSFPDVNFVPVGDTVYAFGGTDVDPSGKETKKTFNMPYWRVFSSRDLVQWTLESEVHPEATYMGRTDQCWATTAAFKNDRWHWYLSNWHDDTGVVVSDSIKGPWRDALGKPLLPADLTRTSEYDSCVFMDDDQRAYIVFGVNFKNGYHIAELNPDLISLKTQPQRLPNNLPKAGDAPFLHKYNGKYYLSSRAEYAVSDQVLGPYEYLGKQDAAGHAGFFKFNNQWYVNFTSRKPGVRKSYRFCSLAYVHYRADGTIAPMEPEIGEYGVGRYNAEWQRIEAEWFFAMSDGPRKTETASGGFEISNLRNGDRLRFPNINNCNHEPVVELIYSCARETGGTVSVREHTENGAELGRMRFPSSGSWTNYQTLSVPLPARGDSTTRSLAFVFEGDAGKELVRLDAFRIGRASK